MQLSKQKKQVLLLYTSTLGGVLFGIVSSVINTHALSPELYGDYRYVQNIIAFISSFLLLGYFTSGSRLLAVSKNKQESEQIRGVMCTILAVTAVLLMIFMLLLCVWSIYTQKINLIPIYMASIPVCSSIVLLNYVNTTAQGDNHIIRISIARLLPVGLYCIFAFFIYRFYKASPELMILLYNGIAIIVLLLIVISTRPSFKNLKSSFIKLNKENKVYGFNVYMGSIVGVSTGYVSGITLGQFCTDNTNVGFYTLALTISSPLATLPAIIGTTYFKKFASQNRIDNKVLIYSILMTVLSCLLFIICISYIVDILYSEKYSQVSIYASWLSISSCFLGLGDMFNRFLGSHGQGKQIRNGAIAGGVTQVLGSFILVYIWGIVGAIVTAIISKLVYFIMMYFYYYQFVKENN